MMAPVIPALNDHEIEALLDAAAGQGATRAGFMPLRLPGEVANLFEAWLREHYPLRATRVLGLIRGMRGGRLNDPRFGHRMRGEGQYAQLLSARFTAACRRSGLESSRTAQLDTGSFLHDPAAPRQADFFS
jgi:DNA repair photolyase